MKSIKEKSEEYAYTNWESDEYHDGDEFDPIGTGCKDVLNKIRKGE